MPTQTSYPEFLGAKLMPWFCSKSQGEAVMFQAIITANEPRELGYSHYQVAFINAKDLDRLNKIVEAEFGYLIEIPEDVDSPSILAGYDNWIEAFAEDWLVVELGWLEVD